MAILALYLGMAALGIVAVRLLKPGEKVISTSQKIQTVALVVVIFTMGMKIGSDEQVINSLHTIGIKALLMVIGALAGSILFVYLGRRFLKIDKRGYKMND